MKVGTKVVKRSRKKFQNGERIAEIQELTTMTIPCSRSRYAREKGEKTVDAVLLRNCKGKVRLSVLEEVGFEVRDRKDKTKQTAPIEDGVHVSEWPFAIDFINPSPPRKTILNPPGQTIALVHKKEWAEKIVKLLNGEKV